jgi:hypothetical protein
LRRTHLALAATLLALSTALAVLAVPNLLADQENKQPDCYIGVAFCGNTTTEAKLLVDKVKSYTNLFIVQSDPQAGTKPPLTKYATTPWTLG